MNCKKGAKMTLQKAFDKFIFAKKVQGLSDKSIADYEMMVGLFVRYVGADVNVESLTRKQVDDYMVYQLNRNLSRSTYASYIRNAKIFLMWLEAECSIDVQATEIKTPKTPKTTPYIYSDKDIIRIFSIIHFDEEWLTYRNKSMVALMLDSGLRQEEICNLKQADVDFHGNIIKVHGKGNKERLVPLGSLAKRFLLSYLELCPHQSKRLFVNLHGENITTTALKQMARKMAKELPFEFSCHKLRHNFATNYCLDQYEQYGKIDIYSLMAIMGHESLQTTERYMHIATQILASRQHVSHLDRILV